MMVFQRDTHTQKKMEKSLVLESNAFLLYKSSSFAIIQNKDKNPNKSERSNQLKFFIIKTLRAKPEKGWLTLTSCLLSLPSEPTQSIIFGKFTPPAKRNSALNDCIVTRFPYSPVWST